MQVVARAALQLPVLHPEQDTVLLGEYVPARQSVHDDALPVLNVPAAHVAHVVALAEPENVPDGHVLHDCEVELV